MSTKCSTVLCTSVLKARIYWGMDTRHNGILRPDQTLGGSRSNNSFKALPRVLNGDR